MKNVSKVTFVIIGTLLGAGFASGQEIQLFFSKYGLQGILGMILTFLLTSLIIYKVFSLIQKRQIHTYSEFLEALTTNHIVNKTMQTIVNLFLLISFYIMIAGFCAYFKQEWEVPIFISAVSIAFLCYITFHKNIQGVISINTILIPALIIIVFYLGAKNVPFTIEHFSRQANYEVESIYSLKWLISSILYASYNSILLIPMLIELSPYMNKKSKIKKVSILCFCILTTLGFCLFSLLLRGSNYSLALELPMLQIVKEFGSIYPIIYGIVIIVAIFTSAISAGYSFLSNVANSSKKYHQVVVLLCVTSVLIAPIGFSNLVNLWYPFFGLLGLIQIFLLSIEKNSKNWYN